MNSYRPSIALFVSLAVLAVAPAAQAGVPNFPNNRIVINKSIAGVALGDSKAEGLRTWGKRAARCKGPYCTWSKAPSDVFAPFAGLTFRDGKITRVELTAPVDGEGRVQKIPKFLKAPRTSKGIGIGSTDDQVMNAYPNAKDYGNYISIPKGSRTTSFSIHSNGRVVSLFMS